MSFYKAYVWGLASTYCTFSETFPMQPNTETLLIIFVALTGVAVLLQACVLFAIFISLRKTAQSVVQVTEDLKSTVIPMVHSTRELLEKITPQIVTVTQGLSGLTETFHKEAAGVRFSAAEIMARVAHQTQRLDTMLTSGLNAVERTGSVLESAVALPVRQVNGIFAAAKAIIATYNSTLPKRRPVYPDPDNDQFI